MSDAFISRDFRLTPEGKKLLEEMKAKEKGDKAGSAPAWSKSRGPSSCDVCLGYCCGKGPYQGGANKAGCKGTKDKKAPSDFKTTAVITKVF